MNDIQLSNLHSGQEAFAVEHMIYAISDQPGAFTVLDYYNPMRYEPGQVEISQFNRHHKTFADVAEFKAEMADLVSHYSQAKELGHHEINSSTSTPWGTAQGGTRYTRGITFYHTARHGGAKLSDGINAQMPDYMRNDGGWYEEDGEFAKVMAAFPQFFTDRQHRQALDTLRNSFPDEYEGLVGEIIPPGASWTKDKRDFEREHADDDIVISAISSSVYEGMVECITTEGGRHGTWNGPVLEEKIFLVPYAEYQTRGPYGFVIDPARHEEIDNAPAFHRQR